MLDRSIPFYNVILRCDNYIDSEIHLPDGYRLRQYRTGDEKAWARLEYEIGDFESIDAAEEYFISTYCRDVKELTKRCMFAVDEHGEIVGSCIAWKDVRGSQMVASLHWLVVSPERQRKGIGRALCQSVMRIFRELGEFSVYIHTQPWSYAAILLYVRMGFEIQAKDTFARYENQYAQAMEVLRGVLTAKQYAEVVASTAPQ